MVSRNNRLKASLALILSMLCASVHSSAFAQTSSIPASVVNHHLKRGLDSLQMIVRSTRILTLDRPIVKYHVRDDNVLAATPVSANQVLISANQPGMTQVHLWDGDDQSYALEIIISADAREVEAILANQFPGSSLKVTPLSKGTGAVLSGTVNNVDDVDSAVNIVEQFYTEVVTNVRVVGVQQIMLHTKIMEVSRTKFRELGIDWAFSNPLNTNGIVLGTGGLIDPPASGLPAITPVALQANARFSTDLGSYNLESLIRALRRNDLVKILAEPTLVTTHGRASRFIVGGKVPYIVPTGNGAVAIQYEEFGTSIDLIAMVVGPGRIRLEVRPEVSEPDPSRSITVQGATIPAFRQRYVDTAVEMNAGQTFAIAGLLQNRLESVSRSVPFFGELPWVGVFFRRISEQNNEIELLITVTPELAEPMDAFQVPPGGPGLETDSPSDSEFYLRGYLEVPRTEPNCEVPVIQEVTSPPAFNSTTDASPAKASMGPIRPSTQPQVVAPGISVVSPEDR